MFPGVAVNLWSSRAAGKVFPQAVLSTPNMLWQKDANLVASYPGSGQDFKNVIVAPSSGEAQSAYDFFIGNNSTPGAPEDPTFVPAGANAAEFTVDGGDIFTIQVMPAFMKTAHKSTGGSPVTQITAFMLGALGTTQIISGDSNSTAAPGWRIDCSATGQLRLARADGTVAATIITLHSGLTTGVPYLHVMTYDPSTGAIKSALNSRTFTFSVTDLFVNTVNITTGKWASASANGSGSRMLAGGKWYGDAMATSIYSDANLSTLVDYYNALHGRTYA